MNNQQDKPITTVCLNDLDTAGYQIENVSEEDLAKIANLMEDSYLENGFWHDLRAAADKVGIPKKSKK